MFWRLTRVVARSNTSFLFIAKQHCIVSMYHILLIHSSAGGHLGCVHLWPLWILPLWSCGDSYLLKYLFSILLSRHLRVELWVYVVILCSTFRGTAELFSMRTEPFYILTATYKSSSISTLSSTLVIFCVLTVAIPVGIRWFLAVALICISLMTNLSFP